MKTYKHKTLGWIARPAILGGNVIIVNDVDGDRVLSYYIDAIRDTINHKLIENSSDREEVVEKEEKDWIYHCIYDIHKWCEDSKYRKTPRQIIRREIEKHVPKETKFTRGDVVNRKLLKGDTMLDNISYTDILCNFLRDNNLLSSDE